MGVTQVDRFAFSVLWEMTPAVDVVSVRYCKSSIHSKAAMTYAEAQALLDDPSQQSAIATSVRHLNTIARTLRCGTCRGRVLFADSLLAVVRDGCWGADAICVCVLCNSQRRMDAGALSLASAEVRFMLDSETHDPLDVAAYQMRDTNELVRHQRSYAPGSVGSCRWLTVRSHVLLLRA